MVPRVGVAVFMTNNEGKFILGKRKGSHGAGESTCLSTDSSITPFQIHHAVQQSNAPETDNHPDAAGTWGLPGGHLEANESFEDCAHREILEETGLHIRNLRFLTATNDVMEAEGKHYVTIFMGAQLSDDSAQPEVCRSRCFFVGPFSRAGLLVLTVSQGPGSQQVRGMGVGFVGWSAS